MMFARYILDKNGTVSDLSKEISNYDAGTSVINLQKDTDYLYIGQLLPFNHLYFKVETENDEASEVAIDYWDGTKWRATVDIIDETVVSGKTLAQSGHISWTIDKQYSWFDDDTQYADDSENITGLGDFCIYNYYWVRVKVSANLNALTEISWVGNLFLQDADLYAEYPLFNSSDYLESVESGKTDWEKQRVIATRLLIGELEQRGKICSPSEIIDLKDIRPAAVARTAALLYGILGRDWNPEADRAMQKAMDRMETPFLKLHKSQWNVKPHKSTITTIGSIQRG